MAKQDRDARIKAKAYELWETEGKPAWQHERHWDHAKSLIEQEEAMQETLLPVKADDAEPAIAFQNQGEFPTTTDQGEAAIGPDYDALSEGEPPPPSNPGKVATGVKSGKGRKAPAAAPKPVPAKPGSPRK